tara:strand:+ start:587 stop:967 length:381 start_codon:yes stop_codon:yes gene_type:complete
MAAYVVTTQCLENYGAHDEDGKFSSGNAYWKFKGGSSYLVYAVDRPADAMAFVMAVFAQDCLSFKEFPTDVQTPEEWDRELPQDEDYRKHLLDKLIHVDVQDFFDGTEHERVYALAASAKGKTISQ